MPTEVGRLSIFTAMTCSKILAASTTSIFLPVMSMMRLRTTCSRKSNDDGQRKSDRQRDQRRDRAVRNDAVVDAHGEQRRRERQHVDDEGRDRDVAVIGAEPADHRPEPMRLRHVSGGDRAGVGDGGRSHQIGKADILRGDGVHALDRRRFAARGIDDADTRRPPTSMANSTRAEPSWNSSTQGSTSAGISCSGRSTSCASKPGSLRRPLVQPDVEDAAFDRQSGQQGAAAQRATVMRREVEQAVAEEIGRRNGGADGLHVQRIFHIELGGTNVQQRLAMQAVCQTRQQNRC